MAAEAGVLAFPGLRVSVVQLVLLDLRVIQAKRATTESVVLAVRKVFQVLLGNEVFRGLLDCLEKTERMA